MYRSPLDSHDAAPSIDAPALAIGCFASICRDRLGDELIAFSRRFPQLDLGILDMERQAQLPALREGRIALAIVPGAPDPGTRFHRLWSDRVTVALPADHALAAAEAVDPAALAEERFFVSRYQHGLDMHRFLARRALPGMSLNTTLHDVGTKRLLTRVAAGEGAMLLCGHNPAGVPADCVIRPMAGGEAAFAVYAEWTEQPPSEALAVLIAMLKEVLPEEVTR